MQLNPDAIARLEIVAGDVPVLTIEDFYLDPDAVREQALGCAFDQSIAYYPGRHALIETPEGDLVKHHLCRILTAIGDRIYDAQTTVTDFSIVTTRPEDLLGQQKHPHIDPTPVFGLVYLNPGVAAGTSFYRNRILGTHVLVTDADRERHADFLAEHGATHEPAGYGLEGNPLWERIHAIEGRYNRLVVYPGNVFHAIDMTDIPPQLTVATARLTQRIIVQHTYPK